MVDVNSFMVFVALNTARVRQTSGRGQKAPVCMEAGVAFQLVKMHVAFTINQRGE